jgi:glutaredoxin
MCYASHPSIAVSIPAPVTEALTAPIPALPPEFPSEPVGQVSQAQVNLAALVRHLKQRGVKMYGADWCPHCQRQKAMFGETFQEINYVECDPNSPKGQPVLCEKANIQAYPTWEINGRLFQGVRTPEELAFLSGFPGKL